MDVYRYGDTIALSGVGGATVYLNTGEAAKLRNALSAIIRDVNQVDFTKSGVAPVHVTPHMIR